MKNYTARDIINADGVQQGMNITTLCCKVVVPQWDTKKSGEYECACGATHSVTVIHQASFGSPVKTLKYFWVLPKSERSWLEKFQRGITCKPS